MGPCFLNRFRKASRQPDVRRISGESRLTPWRICVLANGSNAKLMAPTCAESSDVFAFPVQGKAREGVLLPFQDQDVPVAPPHCLASARLSVGIWALRAPKWMYLRGLSESTNLLWTPHNLAFLGALRTHIPTTKLRFEYRRKWKKRKAGDFRVPVSYERKYRSTCPCLGCFLY